MLLTQQSYRRRVAAVLVLTSFLGLPAHGQGADPEGRSEPSRCCHAAPAANPAAGLYAPNTWPGGVVYFTFNANLTTAQRQVASAAMAALANSSNVTFVARTAQPNWVEYRVNESMGCSGNSSIGMVGGVQYVQGGPCAWEDESFIVHETAHALGMWHEMQRPDRDEFVEIISENITPGNAGNYSIVNATVSGVYDFASTMHYERFGFSVGPATIRVRPPYRRFWQLNLSAARVESPFLSIGDMWALADMYPPAANLPPRPFNLTAPARNVAVGADWSPDFTWQSSTGAESYRLQVDDDITFRSPAIDETIKQTSYAHSSALAPYTLYFWRVLATNANGMTDCYPLPWQAFYTASAYPVALYVDAAAASGGDGTTWGSALRDLKVATETAYASEGVVREIRVAAGTYRPDMGSGDRSQSFILPTGCAVRGGYPGHAAPDPDAREVSLYPTILSGDLLSDDGPNFVNIAENSYHVVTADAPDASAALDGFTIRGGNDDGEPTLLLSGGGGLLVAFGEPTISHCGFSGNSGGRGGGVWLEETTAARLDACHFTRNRTTVEAGGGVCMQFGHATLSNCLFAGNTAVLGGGGLQFFYASGAVGNCTFARNTAAGGGALNMRKNSNGTLTNCVLWDDAAPQGAEIRILSIAGEPTSTLTVVHSDVAGGQAGVLVQPGSSLIWGSSNLTPPADPRFVNAPADDLHLMAGSPCIDAGDPAFVPSLGERDLDGRLRVWDGDGNGSRTVDMGAHEFGAPRCPGDFNRDGFLNSQDFFDFLSAFFSGAPSADFNADSIVNSQDFFDFLAAFFGGC